jgi:hypothetical protein
MSQPSKAYAEGLHAGRLLLAFALNPYGAHSLESDDWQRGWIRATGEELSNAPKSSCERPAQIHPHPSLTAAQCELVCRREGLALANLGRERYVLIPTANRPEPMLRIARPDPEAA